MKRFGLYISGFIFLLSMACTGFAHAKCSIPDTEKCKKSIVLEKRVRLKAPYCFSSRACSSPSTDCDDCIIRMQWKEKINSKETVYDESAQKNAIPNGSVIYFDLIYHIRHIGPCQKPVGTHSGTFKIINPAGSVIVRGSMKGTNGFETHILTGESCKWPHDEGLLVGKFVKTDDPYYLCQLTATYASYLTPPTTVTDVCKKEYWTNWDLRIDGLIQCDCK